MCWCLSNQELYLHCNLTWHHRTKVNTEFIHLNRGFWNCDKCNVQIRKKNHILLCLHPGYFLVGFISQKQCLSCFFPIKWSPDVIVKWVLGHCNYIEIKLEWHWSVRSKFDDCPNYCIWESLRKEEYMCICVRGGEMVPMGCYTMEKC